MPAPPTPKRRPTPPEPTYTTADLLRLTSATKGNLIHWSAIRLIRPDIADSTGSGHHKRYSALNVVEVEIAARLNAFQIPTSLIAEGVDYFRVFHQQLHALWTAGPLDEGDRWTDAQRKAYERVMVRAFLLRDIRGGAEGAKPASFYARSLRDKVTDDEQRELLQMAARWRRMLLEPAYQCTHFFGLFVNPLEAEAVTIADEPFDLNDVMTYAAVVVNLGAVVAALQHDGAVNMASL